MVHNKATSHDDIVSILNWVDEHLSEVESNENENEISDNQESDHKVAHHRVNKVNRKWLQLSVGGMMWNGKWKSGSWMSLSGMMSIPNLI
jgi:hypothetical protein